MDNGARLFCLHLLSTTVLFYYWKKFGPPADGATPNSSSLDCPAVVTVCRVGKDQKAQILRAVQDSRIGPISTISWWTKCTSTTPIAYRYFGRLSPLRRSPNGFPGGVTCHDHCMHLQTMAIPEGSDEVG